MIQTIHCSYLNEEAERLERIPWPGELGTRIYNNISAKAWRIWQERQVVLINEYQLTTMNEEAITLLEKHMLGFLFGEGEFFGTFPDGFKPKEEA